MVFNWLNYNWWKHTPRYCWGVKVSWFPAALMVKVRLGSVFTTLAQLGTCAAENNNEIPNKFVNIWLAMQTWIKKRLTKYAVTLKRFLFKIILDWAPMILANWFNTAVGPLVSSWDSISSQIERLLAILVVPTNLMTLRDRKMITNQLKGNKTWNFSITLGNWVPSIWLYWEGHRQYCPCKGKSWWLRWSIQHLRLPNRWRLLRFPINWTVF